MHLILLFVQQFINAAEQAQIITDIDVAKFGQIITEQMACILIMSLTEKPNPAFEDEIEIDSKFVELHILIDSEPGKVFIQSLCQGIGHSKEIEAFFIPLNNSKPDSNFTRFAIQTFLKCNIAFAEEFPITTPENNEEQRSEEVHMKQNWPTVEQYTKMNYLFTLMMKVLLRESIDANDVRESNVL